MATAPQPPSAAELETAFAALATYTEGSSRGLLVPIDLAVVVALPEAGTRRALETRLIAALAAPAPSAAKEYVCRKLGLIGSDAAVPALAAALDDPALTHAARAALEAIPGQCATVALRESLKRLTGLARVGVVISLGARRDPESVNAIRRFLKETDAQLVVASAVALGRIGDPKAGSALESLLPKAPAALQPAVADACLACADRLAAAGHTPLARSLRREVAGLPLPANLRQAAARGA